MVGGCRGFVVGGCRGYVVIDITKLKLTQPRLVELVLWLSLAETIINCTIFLAKHMDRTYFHTDYNNEGRPFAKFHTHQTTYEEKSKAMRKR